MGFSNPRTPWTEVANRLAGTHTEATGSDAPAYSRPDRHQVSVGPGGSDGTDRYAEPAGRHPARREAAVGWAELHVHSTFSFLDGASSPEDLVDTAAAAGLEALALTDHNGLQGAVQLAAAADHIGLPTVFGSELSLDLHEPIPGQVDPQATHLLVLARGLTGYRQLSATITEANLRGEKNRPVFGSLEELAAKDADWMILTGCRKGPLHQALTDPDGGLGMLRYLVDLFGRDRVVVEINHQRLPDDDRRLDHLYSLAQRCRVPVVATNNVHYATKAHYRTSAVRAAIRARRSLQEMSGWLPPTSARRIHSGEEMLQRYTHEEIQESVRIARECAFSLTAAQPDLPRAPIPAGETEESYLRRLVDERGQRRYGPRTENPRAWAQLDRELTTITTMGFCGYFLIVYDIAEFCAREGIFCQGRGSAANSAVCFVLGITAVDSVRYELLFDRFLAPEREGYPDIDIDIESGRREEVIQYVYSHYGRDRAAQVANVITYRAKSAVRDAAFALGYEPGQQDAYSKGLHRWSSLPEPSETDIPPYVLELAGELLDTPRHLGIHSGGMILADRPIGEIVPIEHATMDDRTVVQWDTDDCAAMNLVKFDLLGLGMLTALHEMIDLIAAHTGERIDRAEIPQEDPAVFEMLCRADAIGVFQVESRAQLATLPRLRPECFYDLAIEVALIRPGPIQGGVVHPYIKRKSGAEPTTFAHPLLENSLGKTHGVPLFQEQLMQMAIDVGGFTGGDADALRKAMGAKRSKRRMAELEARFMAGATTRGVEEATARQIFEQIAAFANYGFPESHAISFANLVYDSAWFKRYHHAAFTAGLLRAQPMGFYSPQSLIADARRHGVPILPVDINQSQQKADLERTETGVLGIRLGLDSVRGVGDAAEYIVDEREDEAYASIADLAERTGAPKKALEGLATAGAFTSFGLDRRQALWIAGGQAGAGPDVLPHTSTVEAAPALPLMDEFETTLAELISTGITVNGYPTAQLRDKLTARGFSSIADTLSTGDGRRITVAGIVTHRQRPATASGITFINLEDEFGMLNVVCTAGLMAHYKTAGLRANWLAVTGLIQRGDGGVVSLYAHKLIPVEVGLPASSRDFR